MGNIILSIKNLNYSYGSSLIFENLSFDFSNGVHVVTGSNGVGKTTLLKCLSGILPMRKGVVAIAGIDASTDSKTFKSQFTFAMDKLHFYPFVTGNDFVNFIFSLRQQHDFFEFDQVLSDFDLAPHLQCKIEDMSLGTQKKLMLVTSLMLDVKCILMDEPTNALDKKSVAALSGYLNKLSKKRCIVLASHDQHLINQVECDTLKLENAKLILQC